MTLGGGQRPNLKSEDSGLRHRFSEAKVSLWMCENGTGHEEARGPTRRRLCCTPFQNFSQRERDVEECHRRVGRVGPEHQSSRRGRGEQRRPLRRRVGNMGACPPPLRGRSAVVARNAACTSGGPKIDSHVDFDSTAHGGITSPCRRQVGASLRRPQRSPQGYASFSESSDCAKSHTGGFWGAVHPLLTSCRVGLRSRHTVVVALTNFHDPEFHGRQPQPVYPTPLF